jgi:hypothetical protein
VGRSGELRHLAQEWTFLPLVWPVMAKPELNTVIVSYGLSLLSQLPLFLLLTLSTDPASAATVASIGDGDTLRVRVREA